MPVDKVEYFLEIMDISIHRMFTLQLWSPPAHRLFMSTLVGASETNILFGAFLLALDRLQQFPPGGSAGEGVAMGGVAMVDPAAVECVLRNWTLGDTVCFQNSVE